MKDGNLEYVIHRLSVQKKTSKETLYQVQWYGYDLANDILEPEDSKPKRFKTR